jgi:hypothetical protein
MIRELRSTSPSKARDSEDKNKTAPTLCTGWGLRSSPSATPCLLLMPTDTDGSAMILRHRNNCTSPLSQMSLAARKRKRLDALPCAARRHAETAHMRRCHPTANIVSTKIEEVLIFQAEKCQNCLSQAQWGARNGKTMYVDGINQ